MNFKFILMALIQGDL